MEVEDTLFYLCLLGLISLAIYLIRIMQQDDRPAESEISGFIPEQAMRTMYNPFVIELLSGSSVYDGAKICLSAGESGYMLSCWGVSIKDIYPLLYMLPADIKKTFTDSHKALDVLQSCCSRVKVTRIDCCVNSEMTLHPDGAVDLGPVPRERFPLVLLLVSDFLSPSSSDDAEHIIFHGLIIHLRDSVCTAASHVISHLIRTSQGKPVDLKHLYTSEVPENSSSHDQQNPTQQPSEASVQNPDCSGESEISNSTSLCIVCLVNPVNKVILPCRHTCVCDFCFEKVTQCPMCRGYVQACFSLADRQTTASAGNEEDGQPGQHWFERLNDWLNRKLGFT